MTAWLEERGFDSVWMLEHTHIPLSRDSEFVAGGPLPRGCLDMMSPFVSLGAASAVSTSLVLATGVAQVFEHDLLDLATAVSTLDVISGGRAVLGVGAGWNREKLANLRPDLKWAQRYAAFDEYLMALRTIWHDETPSFAGSFVSFTESMVNPKPPRRHVDLAIGMTGPRGRRSRPGTPTCGFPLTRSCATQTAVLIQVGGSTGSAERSRIRIATRR